MRARNLLLLIIALLVIPGCGLFNAPPQNETPDNTETPTETPSENEPPEDSAYQTDRMEGTDCIFERTLPKEIRINEPFAVTVYMEAKNFIQTAHLHEDGWFREFRKDRDPIQLWFSLNPGDRRYFNYEVTMWSSQAQTHPFMTGTLSCNTGGLGLSEELKLRSDLNLILNQSQD